MAASGETEAHRATTKPWGWERGHKGDTKALVAPRPPPTQHMLPGIARNSFIYTRTNISDILQNTELKTWRERERVETEAGGHGETWGDTGPKQDLCCEGEALTPGRGQFYTRCRSPPGRGWGL